MSSQPPVGGTQVAGDFDGSTPDDEQLVAYLDGELDRDSTAEIETKLASDPHLRTRLQELRSTWDLLEELPPVKPNPKFARSTIELVALSAAARPERKLDSFRNWRNWTALLLLLPLMFALGYAALRSTQRTAERQALVDLPVLADWDALKDAGSYEWLQKIRSVKFLDRVAKRSSTSGLGVGLVPAGLDERREWIQHLNSTGRDRLSANLEAFKRTTPAQRQRIVDLAQRIYAGPAPLGDLEAARNYAQFLNDLGISERTDHLVIKDEAERLGDLTRRVNRKMVEVYTQELAPDAADREVVRNWIREMEDQYGSALPHERALSDLDRRTAFGDSVIDDVDLDYLLESLSTDAQDIINRLTTPEAKHAALILFVRDTQGGIPGAGGRRNIDRAQLTLLFKGLPEEKKTSIEFLPAEQAQRQILSLGSGSDGKASKELRQGAPQRSQPQPSDQSQ